MDKCSFSQNFSSLLEKKNHLLPLKIGENSLNIKTSHIYHQSHTSPFSLHFRTEGGHFLWGHIIHHPRSYLIDKLHKNKKTNGTVVYLLQLMSTSLYLTTNTLPPSRGVLQTNCLSTPTHS